MKIITKSICITIFISLISGCALIKAATGVLGSSSSSNSGKQLTISPNTNIGDNKKSSAIGTSNTTIESGKTKSLTVTNQRPWYSELQSHITTLLIIGIFLISFFCLIALFRRSPSDKKLIDYLMKQNRETGQDIENLLKQCFNIIIEKNKK